MQEVQGGIVTQSGQSSSVSCWRAVWLAAVLCCLWPLSVPAQPAANESWLAVCVVDADGQPFPAAPTVSLYRLANNTRRYAGRVISTTGNTTSLIDLTVGTYEAQIVLSSHGLTDGPKTVELVSGPNIFVWKLPRVIPVVGALTAADPAIATPPTEVMAFAQSAGKGAPQQARCTLEKDGYHLFGVFPGPYRMLIITDQGYGLVSFTAGEDRKDPVDAPVTLTAGGMLAFEVRRPLDKGDSTPVLAATVTLSSQVERGFTLSITLRTDKEGKAGTPALPPGKWNWAVVAPNLPRASGTITVAPGETQTVAATLGA